MMGRHFEDHGKSLKADMRDIAQDPFFATMFSRMSPGARYLFSEYQLDELKKAFSARGPADHGIDFRLSIPFMQRSYYLVFLVGRERRRAAQALPRAVRYLVIPPILYLLSRLV